MYGNVIHHKGEQGFVRVPKCFKYCGDNCPDNTGKNAGDNHRKYKQGIWDFSAEEEHNTDSGKSSDKHLSLGTDIPEPHFKCGSNGKGYTKQNSQVLESVPNSAFRAEYTFNHFGVNTHGIFSCK